MGAKATVWRGAVRLAMCLLLVSPATCWALNPLTLISQYAADYWRTSDGLPQATTYEEEISAEPWFSVRENDVFPEEFLNFLSLPGPARAALLEQHADLFHPDFWRGVQRKLREGETPEVFPYQPERRLVTAN